MAKRTVRKVRSDKGRARQVVTGQVAPSAPPDRLTAIERGMRGLSEAVKQLTMRMENSAGETEPPVHVETPEERAERERLETIGKIESMLAALKGGNGGAAVDLPAENGGAESAVPTLIPGTYTPQSALMLPMLRALAAAAPGEPMPVREVLARVQKQVKLKPADHEKLSTGATRWENAVMFQRAKAIQTGLLARNQRRGYWQITKEGRKLLTSV